MPASNVPVTLLKTVGEDDIFIFDFVNRLNPLETISSIGTITQVNDATPSATALTLGTPTSGGTEVQVRIQDGIDTVTYTLTCPITTSDGNIKEMCGKLKVQDC